MKLALDEESIFHVANEHDLARTKRNEKQSTFPVPLSYSSDLLWWLVLVNAHPHLMFDNFSVSTDENKDVNCHGHSLGLDKWVDPGAYLREDLFWPEGIPNARLLSVFVQAFEHYGFRVCESPIVERGVERVALFVKDEIYCCHSARQMPDGRWSSKMGSSVLISGHSIGAFSRKVYGDPAIFMRRRAQGSHNSV